MGVELRMLGTAQVSCLLLVAATAQGQAALEQGAEAPEFRCPESNGKFRDSEQCDLFYICRKGVATIEYCPEGLLFDITRVNHEKCVLPHNVDCGDRQFVQEPSPVSDPRPQKRTESLTTTTLQCATSTSSATAEGHLSSLALILLSLM